MCQLPQQIGILTITSTYKKGKFSNFHPNTSRVYLYTTVEKLNSQNLC